jgi:hypothetical protein
MRYELNVYILFIIWVFKGLRDNTEDRSKGKLGLKFMLLVNSVGDLFQAKAASFQIFSNSSFIILPSEATCSRYWKRRCAHTCIFHCYTCMLTTQKPMLWNSEYGFCPHSHFWSYKVSWLYQRKMKQKIPLEARTRRIECFSKFELHTNSRQRSRVSRNHYVPVLCKWITGPAAPFHLVSIPLSQIVLSGGRMFLRELFLAWLSQGGWDGRLMEHACEKRELNTVV